MRAVQQFILERLYPRALDGLPGLGTPAEFAARFQDEANSPRERGETLVLAHIALSSATGFAGGLGGWLTMPITLPANVTGVALLQLHMAASVAALAGKDPSTDLIRSRVLECLIGASPNPEQGPVRDAEQETWDRIGLKLAEKGVRSAISIAGEAVSWGARTAAKGAVKSVAKKRLLRGIPLVGGFIGAVSDGFTTRQVARNALDMFLDDGGLREPSDFPPASGDGLPEGTPSPEPSEPREA